MSSGAVFLDRDGTIIIDTHYPHKPEDVHLIDEAREALLLAQQRGYLLYLFTNQSGIGKGLYTMEDTIACNAHMLKMLELPEDIFKRTCIAPESPGEPSDYRKPSPKFILETIQSDALNPEQCLMVGDKPSDWESGVNAGVNAVAVSTGKEITEEHRQYFTQYGIPLYENLYAFAQSLPEL